MENVLIKHTMDKEFRRMTLNNAFLEALNLSNGCSNKIEEQENLLLEYLNQYPKFIENITQEYKMKVLKGWEYEVVLAADESEMRKIDSKTLEEWHINDFGRVLSIIKGQSFAVVKAEKGDVSLVEINDGDAIIMGIVLEDISDSKNEKTTKVIFKNETYISNIDICTSETTIFFTNNMELAVELLRDEDDVNNSDYDNIVLGRRVTFN